MHELRKKERDAVSCSAPECDWTGTEAEHTGHKITSFHDGCLYADWVPESDHMESVQWMHKAHGIDEKIKEVKAQLKKLPTSTAVSGPNSGAAADAGVNARRRLAKR